jgi:hypothetical protein
MAGEALPRVRGQGWPGGGPGEPVHGVDYLIEAEEQRIRAGLDTLLLLFRSTETAAEHLAIVDVESFRRQIMWLRRHRKALWDDELKPVIKASWARVYPQQEEHRVVAKRVALEMEAVRRERLLRGRVGHV